MTRAMLPAYLMDPKAWAHFIKDVIAPGVAAFGGAWFAFLFQRRRETKRENDERYGAIRFAYFVTMTQFSELELGKGIGRTTIPIVETRSGKKVTFQDDDARKSVK